MHTTILRHSPFLPCSARRAVLAALCAAAPLSTPALAAQDKSPEWTQEKLEAVSREIQKDVETLRGTKFKNDVPVKFLSKDEFVRYAVGRTNQMESEAKRGGDEMALKMLGLIPPDMDLLQENLRLLKDQVGGLYDPTAKTFYLMDNCPVGLAKVVLAHELGHAMDDQIFDIDGTMTKVLERSDAAAAYQAVVEGSGMSVMALWMKEHPKEIDLFGLVGMQDEQLAGMASSPMILWKPLLAAYLKGAQFLDAAAKRPDAQPRSDPHADLDRVFRAPPKSTEQILHPEKYWDLDRRDEPILVQQSCTELPSEWKLLRRDVLGELAIGVWAISPAQRAKVDAKAIAGAAGMDFTSPVSAGWGGDDLVLLGRGEDARVLRWLTVWDSERDAAEFYGAASMILPEVKESLTALAGGKASRAHAAVRYGREREVVVELAFGVKKSELEPVLSKIHDL